MLDGEYAAHGRFHLNHCILQVFRGYAQNYRVAAINIIVFQIVKDNIGLLHYGKP